VGVDERVLERLAAIEAAILRLADLIERGNLRPARPDHSGLLAAIFEAVEGRAFTVSELLVHARIDLGLRAAIVAAVGSLNGRALGRALRRIEGIEICGVVIERVGADSSGVIWSVKPSKTLPAIPRARAAG
jgi:hypothetical protein